MHNIAHLIKGEGDFAYPTTETARQGLHPRSTSQTIRHSITLNKILRIRQTRTRRKNRNTPCRKPGSTCQPRVQRPFSSAKGMKGGKFMDGYKKAYPRGGQIFETKEQVKIYDIEQKIALFESKIACTKKLATLLIPSASFAFLILCIRICRRKLR